MSSVGDFLFGSKPKKAKGKDFTPEEFVGLRGPVASSLQRILTGGGLPGYEGPLAAQLTADELASIEALTGLAQPSAATNAARGTFEELAAGVTNPYAGAVGLSDAELYGLGEVGGLAFGNSDLTGASRDLLMRTLSGDLLTPDSNPFLSAAINAATRPILENFDLNSRALRGQFTAAGQSTGAGASSPFEAALARLTGGVANVVGDTSASLAFNAYEAERGRQTAALSLAEALPGADLERALAGLSAFALPREVAQAGADRQSAAFESDAARRLEAASALPEFNRAQIDDTLRILEAQALPRLVEQLGIDRGLEEFRRQQQTLLQALSTAGGLASPTVAVLPGTPGQTGLVQDAITAFLQGGGSLPGTGGGA